MKKTGLGKGLEALFEENIKFEKDVSTLNIDMLEVNKNQPRKNFNDESLYSLAESIKENGIIQPIIVRPIGNGRYQIIAGERRFRAANIAGVRAIPVVVKDVEDYKTAEIALIENLQREDLNPIEEAKGYLNLIEKYNLTQDEVAKKVGKSRSAVTNSIRLLNLPQDVKKEVISGRLTSGQARALLAIKDEYELKKMALNVIEKGMSVREIERMANIKKGREKNLKNKKVFEDNIFKDLEKNIQTELKRNVKIEVISGEKGRITIDFYNRDELVDMAYSLAGLKKQKGVY